MDLGVKGGSWSPGFAFYLVVSRCIWEPHEAVTFNPMSIPAINRVNLHEQIRSRVVHEGILGFKLIVKRKTEMTHVVGFIAVLVLSLYTL